MRLESRREGCQEVHKRGLTPLVYLLVYLCASSLLAGCDSMSKLQWPTSAPNSPAPTAAPTDAQLVADYLATLDNLARATPAAQAELADNARRAAVIAPTTPARVRWALILAAPGHANSDPIGARTLLGELLAAPERLQPGERALAVIMLREVNARLALTSEAGTLRQTAANAQTERERAAAQARRLQSDNERLREELEKARAKLAAIAELERTMLERKQP